MGHGRVSSYQWKIIVCACLLRASTDISYVVITGKSLLQRLASIFSILYEQEVEETASLSVCSSIDPTHPMTLNPISVESASLHIPFLALTLQLQK